MASLRALGLDGISVAVKTNYGPAVTVYRDEPPDGTGGEPGDRGVLEELLGFKAALIVRDRDGRTIYTSGDVPATEPARVAAVIVLVAVLAFVLTRGVLK